MQSELSDNLQGRKSVRLRVRQNLQFTPQAGAGETGFVVKDPVSLRYFHFDQTQRDLLGLMDGTQSLEEVRQSFETTHRPQRMSLEELEDFARQLLQSNLVYHDAPGAAELAIELTKKQNRQKWLARLNILQIKIPLASPNDWLKRCRVIGDVVFSAWFLTGALTLMLAALGLLATHWQEFQARLPAYGDFFSLQTLALCWITLGGVKILHELGHAFCCKRMGANVQQFGVLVLFFFPTLYCNVSDSWTLPNKWKRMAIAAAGIYVELILASLATFLWWFSDPNTLIHNLCFVLMTVCSVNALLFNANPLMRFDGYYILADWLEMPNLAQQATQALQRSALRWLGIPLDDEDGKHSLFLFWFGITSAVYRWYVVALTLYMLSEFFKRYQMTTMGAFLVAFGVAALIGIPVYQVARWLHRLGSFQNARKTRTGLTLGVISLLIVGFFLLPFPRRIGGVALVQVLPDQVQRVVIPETEGFLQEIRVRDGRRVRAGDVLAILSNPKLEMKIRVTEADQALRYQQQQALVAQLTDNSAAKDERMTEWQQCDQELRSLTQTRQMLQEQRERLILRAPTSGVVMGLPSPEDQGKWLEKGTEFCRVANGDALRALVLVDPSDHADIHPGASALIRVHGSGSKQMAAFVTGIAQVEAKNIPAALSRRVAGDVATQYDAATHLDKPHGQHYLVSVQFGDNDGTIHPGALAGVKVDAESRTLWWRLRRFLGTTFNWGL